MKRCIKLLAIAFLALLLIWAASAQNCTAQSGNLIKNSDLELGSADTPDNWKTNITGSQLYGCPNYTFSWENDPVAGNAHNKVLAIQYAGNTRGTYCGWQQTISAIEEETWYELSVSFTTEGIEPMLDTEGNMLSESTWIGASVGLWDESWGNLGASESEIAGFGPELTEWNDSTWVYNTYKTKSLENWKTVKKYFKTPPGAKIAQVKTHNYTKGKAYFDDFSLKKFDCNPEEVSFKKSGTLQFIQYKNQNFFPTFLFGIPKENGTEIDLSTVKATGFNTVGFQSYKGDSWPPNLKKLLIDNDLAYIRPLTSLYYPLYMWRNNKAAEYTGAEEIRKVVNNWNDFGNLLAFIGKDEIDCHPARDGTFLPELKPYKTISEYVRNNVSNNASNVEIMMDFCGGSYTVPTAYTGGFDDLTQYYFPLTDIVTFTGNLPPAYPAGSKYSVLNKMGLWIRSAKEKAPGKFFFARGFSTYYWSNWNRARDPPNESNYNKTQFIPFNLQRFQLLDDIINGAVGAWFPYTSNINLNDPQYAAYHSHHWQQITTIAKELAELYDVLLEPQFFDEWNISDGRIEAMMKKHNGKIYLLTASTHYEDLRNVTITLDSKYNIAKITALNEVINGDVDNPIDRSITPASPNSFVDDFVGDDGSIKVGKASPGYAVHVYEIELSACGNTYCETGESFESCPADCLVAQQCGNGAIDSGEQCDGSNIPSTCTALGYRSGTIACTAQCTFDTSNCIAAECTNSGDCSNGLVCCNRSCRMPACTSNADCSSGATCISAGECNASCITQATVCQIQPDCPAGQLCCSNKCTAVKCFEDSQCNDDREDTTDKCDKAGTCTAECTHTPTGTRTPPTVNFQPSLQTGETQMITLMASDGTPIKDFNITVTWPDNTTAKITAQNGIATITADKEGTYIAKIQTTGYETNIAFEAKPLIIPPDIKPWVGQETEDSPNYLIIWGLAILIIAGLLMGITRLKPMWFRIYMSTTYATIPFVINRYLGDIWIAFTAIAIQTTLLTALWFRQWKKERMQKQKEEKKWKEKRMETIEGIAQKTKEKEWLQGEKETAPLSEEDEWQQFLRKVQ